MARVNVVFANAAGDIGRLIDHHQDILGRLTQRASRPESGEQKRSQRHPHRYLRLPAIVFIHFTLCTPWPLRNGHEFQE